VGRYVARPKSHYWSVWDTKEERFIAAPPLFERKETAEDFAEMLNVIPDQITVYAPPEFFEALKKIDQGVSPAAAFRQR